MSVVSKVEFKVLAETIVKTRHTKILIFFFLKYFSLKYLYFKNYIPITISITIKQLYIYIYGSEE